MSVLAIKGHKERGKEVIALLEMLGGYNDCCIPYDGSDDDIFYRISDDDRIVSSYFCPNKTGVRYRSYTLEEFEKEFPFKVGDEVRYFIFDVAVNCPVEETAVVRAMTWQKDTVTYTLDNNLRRTAKDLCPIEKDASPDKAKAPVLQGQDYSEGKCGYKIPEGFELDKVEEGEIILKPRKKELPKTYGECCEVLGINELPYMVYTWNRNEDVEVVLFEPQVTLLQQLETLRKIITCRNAYWRLAGDWEFKIGSDSQEVVYAITIWGTGVLKDFYHALNCNRVLVFPTKEMRDTFYENFKDLINECKELL